MWRSVSDSSSAQSSFRGLMLGMEHLPPAWCSTDRIWDLTQWPLGDLDSMIYIQYSILFFCWVSSDLLIIMPLRWMSTDLTDDKSLVQVMVWCRQATSHYLSQCWPRSMSPHGVTRLQWVNKSEYKFWIVEKNFYWFSCKWILLLIAYYIFLANAPCVLSIFCNSSKQ